MAYIKAHHVEYDITRRLPELDYQPIIMGLPTSKKKAGLGNALMNDRLGKNGGDRRRGTEQGITRTAHNTGETVRDPALSLGHGSAGTAY